MSALGKSKQWPFAALDPSKEAAAGTKQLHGIVFDVDGTLCKPNNSYSLPILCQLQEDEYLHTGCLGHSRRDLYQHVLDRARTLEL
jgi:phosphoglycolate phosphatase-like HAD superfamily hydrolase